MSRLPNAVLTVLLEHLADGDGYFTPAAEIAALYAQVDAEALREACLAAVERECLDGHWAPDAGASFAAAVERAAEDVRARLGVSA